MTPRGAAAIGGMLDLQGDQTAPTVDGREIAARVAVWFLPPQGEKTAGISIAGDVFSRAALFRPGFIGPWTYVLLLLAWPLLVYAAIRLLAHRRRARQRAPRWASGSSPSPGGELGPRHSPLRGPDEPDHFATSRPSPRVGKGPDRAPVRASPTPVARRRPRCRARSTPTSSFPRPGHRGSRWRGAVEAARPDQAVPPMTAAAIWSRRPRTRRRTTPSRLPAYAAAGPDNPFSALTSMRLISALLGALTAVCAFLTVRELFPRHQRLGGGRRAGRRVPADVRLHLGRGRTTTTG